MDLSKEVRGVFSGIGTSEILIILLLLLLLFGAKRIPEVARGIGKGISEFKQGLRGEEPLKRSEIEREKDS
ncbi:MAG: twin-arginine translocase TatA/TatE family subunit [Candidatus Latescibacteria bacterium]|nr:twin-arginine translocase TatA/TatE family subunit [Candidatus Latescibacterota bacterium]